MYSPTAVYTMYVCVVAEAVSAINRAVEVEDAEATLEALQATAANLHSITDECKADYASSLATARREKVEAGGEEGEGWTEHHTREGHTLYHNWQLGESQWEKPDALPEQSSQLSREEIQVRGNRV